MQNDHKEVITITTKSKQLLQKYKKCPKINKITTNRYKIAKERHMLMKNRLKMNTELAKRDIFGQKLV